MKQSIAELKRYPVSTPAGEKLGADVVIKAE